MVGLNTLGAFGSMVDSFSITDYEQMMKLISAMGAVSEPVRNKVSQPKRRKYKRQANAGRKKYRKNIATRSKAHVRR